MSILEQSQSNNYERYVTGFLAHNGRVFMQVLEGPEEEVRRTYTNICEDPRHTGVTQIMGETVQQRAFEDWSMNYHRVDAPGGAMSVRRDEAVEDLMPQGAPRDLLAIFAKFISVR